ncbi:hypothetical protein GGP41_008919 [Bipolaris sorokiniana]|uniref:Uncharacterized protein n=1 Tax=Cochliobolus sativus TaxID=45130 RepID=A0A8H6DTC4_COCSA|nr:hypothetical protein GGP41_008919 [Bipolaris sorokiniana]
MSAAVRSHEYGRAPGASAALSQSTEDGCSIGLPIHLKKKGDLTKNRRQIEQFSQFSNICPIKISTYHVPLVMSTPPGQLSQKRLRQTIRRIVLELCNGAGKTTRISIGGSVTQRHMGVRGTLNEP